MQFKVTLYGTIDVWAMTTIEAADAEEARAKADQLKMRDLDWEHAGDEVDNIEWDIEPEGE